MERPEPRPARSSKYIVAPRLGRWSVRRDEQDAGAFASLDDAVRFACGQAREQAMAGAAGVVVVQADVPEMHCFTPPHPELAAAPQPPLRLRVIQGGS
jgi:hypothetical protein